MQYVIGCRFIYLIHIYLYRFFIVQTGDEDLDTPCIFELDEQHSIFDDDDDESRIYHGQGKLFGYKIIDIDVFFCYQFLRIYF